MSLCGGVGNHPETSDAYAGSGDALQADRKADSIVVAVGAGEVGPREFTSWEGDDFSGWHLIEDALEIITRYEEVFVPDILRA
jgi:hypothetical protein